MSAEGVAKVISPDDTEKQIDGIDEDRIDELIGELMGEEDLGDIGVDMKCGECGPEKIEAGGDERQVKKLGDPRMPTAAEVEDHNRTHLPYRNWCYHCVRGKGKDLDHRREVTEDRGLSEYSFDYCFPGDEFGFKLTILVGRERERGVTMAAVVPVKGSSGRFATEKIIEFMEECGDSNMGVIV